MASVPRVHGTRRSLVSDARCWYRDGLVMVAGTSRLRVVKQQASSPVQRAKCGTGGQNFDL